MARKRLSFALSIVALFVSFSCEKDDPKLPDNLISFTSNELGIGADEDQLTFTLSYSRALSTETSVVIEVTATGVAYGVDFTTDPPTIGSSMVVTMPAGTTTANVTLTKAPGSLFDGDESVVFAFGSAAGTTPAVGENPELTVHFAEILASSGSMEIQGGGSLFPNKVFIDFSGNRQTAVERVSWDLGFSSGADFRVVLNSSNGAMARMLDKTDLTLVTAADTIGWGQQLSIAAVFAAINAPSPPAWASAAIQWIDDPTGNLNSTAIGAISLTASENKVYIINRGSGPGTPAPALGWKKMRIVRNGNQYTIQHADIGSANFTESTIAKNPENRFNYFKFDAGAVTVEPHTTRWDLAWTGFTNTTMSSVGPVPYYFQDIVLQNTVGVQTAKVLNSTLAYENFTETDLAGLTFSTSQIGIGSDWRSGGGPGVSPFVRTDRYYIVKDADDNYYKVKFTALTTSGERGKPQLEFALVKAGS